MAHVSPQRSPSILIVGPYFPLPHCAGDGHPVLSGHEVDCASGRLQESLIRLQAIQFKLCQTSCQIGVNVPFDQLAPSDNNIQIPRSQPASACAKIQISPILGLAIERQNRAFQARDRRVSGDVRPFGPIHRQRGPALEDVVGRLPSGV